MSYDHLRHRRVYHFDEQLSIHGERFVALMEALHRCDPLADRVIAALGLMELGKQDAIIEGALEDRRESGEEVPQALTELVEAVQVVPDWVDWSRIDRGAATLMRTGVFGGITLGAKSLVEG